MGITGRMRVLPVFSGFLCCWGPGMYCYRHPKVETLLRCQKCERPICTDCSRISPVGARCRDCTTIRSSHLFQVGADRLAIGALAGVSAGFVVGYLLVFLSGIGFFLIWGG